MRSVALLAVIVAAQLLNGCGSTPDVSDQLRTVASWTATLQLAREQHRSGAITTRYVAQLDDAAKHALADARQSLPNSEHDASDTARAAAALDSLDRAIHQLDVESHP